MARFFSAMCFFLAFAGLFTACLPESEKPPTVTTASDLKVYEYFSDFAPYLQTDSDTTYVVNFWATWCKPCVEELPAFMKLQEEYQEKGEAVRFLFVSLDFKKQIDSKLRPFLAAGRLKGEVVSLVDPASSQWIEQVSVNWSGAIPATLIFNKGKRTFYEGGLSYNDLKANVQKHL